LRHNKAIKVMRYTRRFWYGVRCALLVQWGTPYGRRYERRIVNYEDVSSMMLIAVSLGLVIFFFYFNRGEFIERQAYYAIAFMALYIAAYLFVPSQLNGTSVQTGRLYEVIPLMSLGAILFPHFNPKSPEVITQTLGWLGLISVSIILCVFKVFVW